MSILLKHFKLSYWHFSWQQVIYLLLVLCNWKPVLFKQTLQVTLLLTIILKCALIVLQLSFCFNLLVLKDIFKLPSHHSSTLHCIYTCCKCVVTSMCFFLCLLGFLNLWLSKLLQQPWLGFFVLLSLLCFLGLSSSTGLTSWDAFTQVSRPW